MKKKKKIVAPQKMFLKKGDKVLVIAGAYKGAKGEVLEVLPKRNRVIVDEVNIVKKHQKPTETDTTGGIKEIPAPIHASNLMVIDPKTGEPTRIGRRYEDGKLVRYSKKSGEIIK